MKIPLVAIVGLPNSGKSTFFNKVLGRRTALTHKEAGTTRDRAYGLTHWDKLSFYLIDTAGIIPHPDSPLEKSIQRQTAIAQEEADLIVFMADGKTMPSSQDIAVASKLQRSGKPFVLAVNKVDVRTAKSMAAASAYKKLGLGEPFLISSVNGSGVGDLLDAITSQLKQRFSGETPEYAGYTKVVFLGKPNVGKSSLINTLLREDRLLVDAKAGTTRSTVEIPFEHAGKKFLLLDTAGVKKKWKQDIDIETAAMMQSLRTVAQTDIVLFVVDASSTITAQDQIITQKILEHDRPVVVLLNKTDLIDEDRRQRLLDILPNYFPQLWWAPVVFTNHADISGIHRALDLALKSTAATQRRVEPEQLDSFLDEILKRHMPGKMADQRAPKIYNLKQIDVNPPVFKVSVNFSNAIAPSWRKFFEKQFRLKFGFEGTPVVFRYVKKD